ncbi:MAG: hypothetical protein DMD79_12250, partial [Candidatus Rokuibacteriota bacterium]
MSDVKDVIRRTVDDLAGELEALSRMIHDHPELGYGEVRAAGWLTAFLEAKGFRVERGGSTASRRPSARPWTGEPARRWRSSVSTTP